MTTIFGTPGPKRRFALVLVSIYLISLPIVSYITYIVLRNSAVETAYAAGRLYLSSIGATKQYVSDTLRPVFYREMPGRFIVEGMSRSFMASRVASKVHEMLPQYVYKNASLNPRNPDNTADEFEAGIIGLFRQQSGMSEWTGFRERAGDEFYVIARPGERFTGDCLRCHGDPEQAPKELVVRYGPRAGFNMKTDELADAAFVYIPIGVPLVQARKAVAIFIALYIGAGVVILLVVNIRFLKLYDTIESDRHRIEEFNFELINLSRDLESIIAERTLNLLALSAADRIRNPASAIAGTINRVLKKENMTDTLREKLTGLIDESAKLDAIVKDYETILKTRHTMFKVEDLNELVIGIVPLIESERGVKEISLDMKLSDAPARFMANRQLIKAAIINIVTNAIEAVPDGGKISVSTSADGDSVSLSVTDNGEGIAREDLQNIFDPLYSTKSHRMGMGLPITRQIVEEHRGHMTVQSDAGLTTFVMTFPARWSEKGLFPPAES